MFSSSENMFPCPPSRPSIMERKWKPNVELAPNCPRCDSSNTKFCYYNNYSLSQPRYFCKGCRRYWTKGGSLRNVPVGGGCRKNRRGKSIRVSTDHRGVNVSGSTYGHFTPCGDFSDTIGDDPLESLGVSGENCTGRSTGESGQDASGIDLAAVYAKFLNQRSDVDSGVASGEFSASPMELSNASNRNQSPQPTVEFSQEHNLVECQRPVDLTLEAQLNDSHQMYLGEFDLNCKEKDRLGQYTSTAESSDFGFESLSSEGALQDIFWSNNYQIPSNYTPQSLHQPHGFDYVLEDHLSTLHPNLQNGNWGSFDLPCYDAFTRP